MKQLLSSLKSLFDFTNVDKLWSIINESDGLYIVIVQLNRFSRNFLMSFFLQNALFYTVLVEQINF